MTYAHNSSFNFYQHKCYLPPDRRLPSFCLVGVFFGTCCEATCRWFHVGAERLDNTTYGQLRNLGFKSIMVRGLDTVLPTLPPNKFISSILDLKRVIRIANPAREVFPLDDFFVDESARLQSVSFLCGDWMSDLPISLRHVEAVDGDIISSLGLLKFTKDKLIKAYSDGVKLYIKNTLKAKIRNKL